MTAHVHLGKLRHLGRLSALDLSKVALKFQCLQLACHAGAHRPLNVSGTCPHGRTQFVARMLHCAGDIFLVLAAHDDLEVIMW